MKYIQLGETNLNVSRICCGTWQFGGDWGSFEQREAQDAIGAALELGINFFDTAQAYGFGISEQVLGKALRPELKTQREDIILATKGGLRMEGPKLLRDSSPEYIRKGVEESLKNLDVDYIDLYQVHWPDPNTPLEATAEALDRLVREGKIRYVGVSNFNIEQMSEFQKTRKLDALQPPYHLFRRDVEQDILPYCEEQGIGVLVYGPLAHGLLGGKYAKDTKFATDDWRSKSQAFQGDRFTQNIAVVGLLKVLAETLGLTVAQLAVAWVLANPAVDVAIVGARRPEQLEAIAPAADAKLSADALEEIEAIMSKAVPTGGPSPEGM